MISLLLKSRLSATEQCARYCLISLRQVMTTNESWTDPQRATRRRPEPKGVLLASGKSKEAHRTKAAGGGVQSQQRFLSARCASFTGRMIVANARRLLGVNPVVLTRATGALERCRHTKGGGRSRQKVTCRGQCSRSNPRCQPSKAAGSAGWVRPRETLTSHQLTAGDRTKPCARR